jgi:antitoxin VapB
MRAMDGIYETAVMMSIKNRYYVPILCILMPCFFSCYATNKYIHYRIYYFREAAMKTAKIFKSGNSQAVRLPKEFQLEGDEVYLKKQNDVLILIPKSDPWSSLRRSLDHFSEDFMAERIQPDMAEREDLS